MASPCAWTDPEPARGGSCPAGEHGRPRQEGPRCVRRPLPAGSRSRCPQVHIPSRADKPESTSLKHCGHEVGFLGLPTPPAGGRVGWPEPRPSQGGACVSMQGWASPSVSCAVVLGTRAGPAGLPSTGRSQGGRRCSGLAGWQPCPQPDATHPSPQNLVPAPLVLSSVHELDLFR